MAIKTSNRRLGAAKGWLRRRFRLSLETFMDDNRVESSVVTNDPCVRVLNAKTGSTKSFRGRRDYALPLCGEPVMRGSIIVGEPSRRRLLTPAGFVLFMRERICMRAQVRRRAERTELISRVRYDPVAQRA